MLPPGVRSELFVGEPSSDESGDDAIVVAPVEPRAVAMPWLDYLTSLCVKEGDVPNSNHYEFVDIDIDTNRRRGLVHFLDGDVWNQKATCNSHKKCVCWIKIPVARRTDLGWHAILRDQVKWLSMACDSSEHADSARAFKIQHGLRPK